MVLPGCAGSPRAAAIASSADADWRTVATREDRGRLARARLAWNEALPAAPRDEAADAALFDPDRALAQPLPPPGDYRCRTIKLGTQGAGGRAYIAYPFFTCRVAAEGRVTSLSKLTGSQRPVGLLLPADATRAAFLGTLLLGDEIATVDYGRDRMRDMAGWMERVGPARWRLSLPYPHYESKLDVIELVPAT